MNKYAFTLIELLVVIAIIGILSGLIIVTMNGVTQKANIAKAQIFSNSLRNALMLNIMGEWKFDSIAGTVGSTLTDGTVIVDSWSTNNGTTSGGPTLRSGSDCVSGQCLSFDGSNDYVNCGSGDNLNSADAITIEAWVYPTAWSDHWLAIFTKGTDWSTGVTFWLDPTGQTIFSVAGTHYTFGTISLNTWTHLAATFSLSSQKIIIYANGIAFSPQTRTTALPTQTPNRIGIQALGIYPAGYGQFKGLIDHVRIYNVAVPTSQIKEQYYSGLNSMLASGNISKEEYQERLAETALR